MKDLKTMLLRVGDDVDFGLHGWRVAGYNLAKRKDPELANAHGRWKPGSSSAYDRFSLKDVFGMASAMVGGQDVYAGTTAASPAPRAIGRLTAEERRDRERHTVVGDGGAATEELPPGWTKVGDSYVPPSRLSAVGVSAQPTCALAWSVHPLVVAPDAVEGAASEELPPGWRKVGDSYVPPSPMDASVAPQATCVLAWAIHRSVAPLMADREVDIRGSRTRARAGAV